MPFDGVLMVTANLSSGSSVKLGTDGREMTVVGFDSVGSLICEWGDGEGRSTRRGYFTPSLLTNTDSDASTAETLIECGAGFRIVTGVTSGAALLLSTHGQATTTPQVRR